MSTATTRAPAATAIITAARPTPPQPCTATHSPACTARVDVQRGPRRHEAAAQRRRLDVAQRIGHRDEVQVRPRQRDVLRERTPGREAGLEVAVADLGLAQAARFADAAAAAEGHGHAVAERDHPRTAGPTSATTPHSSWPGTWGSTIDGSWPIQPCQSLRQTPVARTATTTPSSAQTGSATVSIVSGSAKERIMAARIALLSRAVDR